MTIEELILNDNQQQANLAKPMRSLTGGKIAANAITDIEKRYKTCAWLLWFLAALILLAVLLLPWLISTFGKIEAEKVMVSHIFNNQTLAVVTNNQTFYVLNNLIRQHEQQNTNLRRQMHSLIQRFVSLENESNKNEKLSIVDQNMHSLTNSFEIFLTEYNVEMNLMKQQMQGQNIELVAHYAFQIQDLQNRLEILSKKSCNCSKIAPVTTYNHDVNILQSVQLAIKEALDMYDADKIGLPDFASEPAGGSIVGTGCTETYESETRLLSWAWFPLWFVDYSPRIIIQPGLTPGACWSIKGHRGTVMIKLSRQISVTGVSYEHIRKKVSPDGKIETAPKKMQIFGLLHKDQDSAVVLGNFTYDDNGSALQYFPIEDFSETGYPIVELKILSNHGHPVYTCLYRFRVHGTPVDVTG